MLTRRHFIIGLGALAGASLASGPGMAAPAELRSVLAQLAREVDGRLGVAVHDLETGRIAGHDMDARFPMCSTFKLLACAALLARVDGGREDLQRRIVFGKQDLVTYSPVTEKLVGGDGVTLDALAHATMTLSDNTAANLILDALGGPAEVTAFLRGIGDEVTRLDRIEPELNSAIPGDVRDTTTPAAMAQTIRKLLYSDTLAPASREKLLGWMRANQTGGKRLRAGTPDTWQVGEKTGSGANGTTNDAGVLLPPGRRPVIVAAYLTECDAAPEVRDAALAAVARAARVWVSQPA